MSSPLNNGRDISKNFGEQIAQTVGDFDSSLQIISAQGPEIVSVENAYSEGSR